MGTFLRKTVQFTKLAVPKTKSKTGKIFIVNKALLSMQGRQHSFVQCEMKELLTGQKFHEKMRPAEKIDSNFHPSYVADNKTLASELRIERIPHQFLYRQERNLFFMNTTTFDQKSLPMVIFFMNHNSGHRFIFLQDSIADRIDYLTEGMIVDLSVDEEDNPLLIHLPEKVHISFKINLCAIKAKSSRLKPPPNIFFRKKLVRF